MRISDWSSDVCSSDLLGLLRQGLARLWARGRAMRMRRDDRADRARRPVDLHVPEMPAVMRYNSRKPIDQTGRHRYARTLRDGSGLPERSEEHTSELQPLMRISYAVFCLKKTNTYNHIIL